MLSWRPAEERFSPRQGAGKGSTHRAVASGADAAAAAAGLSAPVSPSAAGDPHRAATRTWGTVLSKLDHLANTAHLKHWHVCAPNALRIDKVRLPGQSFVIECSVPLTSSTNQSNVAIITDIAIRAVAKYQKHIVQQYV